MMSAPSHASMLFIALLALVLLLVIPMMFPRSSFSVAMALKVMVLGVALLTLIAVLSV